MAATGRESHGNASRMVSATKAELRGCRIVPDETQKGCMADRKETAAGG